MLCDNQRVYFIDLIRGACILLMFFDHIVLFSFNLIEFKQFAVNYEIKAFCRDYLLSDFRRVARYIVMAVFFAISGFCCKYSKNNIKRFVKLALASYILSVFTYLIELLTGYKCFIICGVLFCYSVYVLFYELLNISALSDVVVLELGLLSIVLYLLTLFIDIEIKNNFLIFLGIPSAEYIAQFEYVPPIKFWWSFCIGIICNRHLFIKNNSVYCNNLIAGIGKHGLKFYFLQFFIVLLFIIC